MFNFIQLNMMNVLSIYLMRSFDIKEAALGFIGSTYFYTNLIFTFFSGMLLDLFSPKRLVISAICISLCGLIYFIVIPSIFSLVIWRLAAGVTCAFTITGTLKIIAEYFYDQERGLAIGLVNTVVFLAGIISQLPFSLVLKNLGINIALLIVFGMGFCSLCLVYFFISHHKQIKHNTNFIHTIISTCKIFSDFKNLCAALFACFTNLPLFILGALWGSAYLMRVYNMRSGLAAVIVSMLFLGHMIGAPVFGFLTDRMRSRRGLSLFGAGMAIISALLISLFSYHPFCEEVMLCVLFFFLGVSTSSQIISWTFVVSNSRKDSVARAVSLVGLISVFGGVVFQPMFGLLVQHSGNLVHGYQQAMLMLIFTSFFACIFGFYIPNKSAANNKKVVGDVGST